MLLKFLNESYHEDLPTRFPPISFVNLKMWETRYSRIFLLCSAFLQPLPIYSCKITQIKDILNLCFRATFCQTMNVGVWTSQEDVFFCPRTSVFFVLSTCAFKRVRMASVFFGFTAFNIKETRKHFCSRARCASELRRGHTEPLTIFIV